MIIKSFLDTDLYKFTMAQAVFHQFPGAKVEYQFRCRSKGIDLRPLEDRIGEEILALSRLYFRPDELEYLKSLRFIKSDFIDFLRIFRFNPDYVSITSSDDGLRIFIDGPWLHTILYEVPLLAIINELYFNDPEKRVSIPKERVATFSGNPIEEGRHRLTQKIQLLKDYDKDAERLLLFADYGTRRRYGAVWQDEVVGTMAKELPHNFIGTSNVMLAQRYGLVPIGTMAHEWLQAMQAMVRVSEHQKYAFECWAKEYRGDLGIALSDNMGFDAFLRDFDLYFCKLFDGARHDSGDPYEWTNKLIRHYQRHRIDPMTKRAVYSDGLTIPAAISLHREFQSAIDMGFGIGTNLTNDVGYEPLNIVIKMTRCNGHPVAKVSEARGKTICEDKEYLDYLKKVFQING